MSGRKVLLRLLESAVKRAAPLTCLTVTLGLVGVFLLPLVERRSFFDENALIVDTADNHIRAHLIQHRHDTVLQAIERHLQSGGDVVDWLSATLPPDALSFQAFPASRGARECTNVHAIARSPRGDGSEGIVLVTPVAKECAADAARCRAQSPEGAAMALAAGWGMYSYLAAAPWLAKDFVWLVPDASCGAVESVAAWMDHYQKAAPQSNATFVRAGTLQQALVLDLPVGSWGGVEVTGEASDGQLPKLDLFVLAHNSFARYAGARVQLPGPQHLHLPQALRPLLLPAIEALDPRREFVDKVTRAASMIGRQALGRPTGAHGPFKSYFVDAVTVRTLPREGVLRDSLSASDLLLLCSALEAFFRCCNNLLEKLHHSYFMYLQPSVGTFVAIEMYILPSVLLLLSLALWGAHVVSAAAPPAARGVGDGDLLRGLALSLRLVASVYVGSLCAGGLVSVAESMAGRCDQLDLDCLWRATNNLIDSASSSTAGTAAAPVRAAVVLSSAVLLAAGVQAWRPWQVVAPRSPPHHAAASQQWRHVKALVLFVTVIMMAGWSCINWTVVHVALMLLVLPLLTCQPLRLMAFRQLPSAAVFCSTWIASCPVVVFALVHLADEGVLSHPDQWPSTLDWRSGWLQHLYADSTFLGKLFVWAIYLPTWLACGVISTF